MVIFYKKWKKYYEIQLTKNKRDLRGSLTFKFNIFIIQSREK